MNFNLSNNDLIDNKTKSLFEDLYIYGNFRILMKTAVITGGAHGIGKAIVHKLCMEEYNMIVLDSNLQYIDELKQELIGESIEIYSCDVGNPEEVENAIKKIEVCHQNIDCIVNNAGISFFEPVDKMNIETWNRILSVNLSSIFYLVKFIRHLLTENSAIVNVASTRYLMSEAHTEAYAASKGGIVSLTHALAVSLGPKTRVNCVSPGWIQVNNYESLSDEDHAQHPVGKVGKPENIAEVVAFLLSEKAQFITGQNIVVDGGMTKKMIYV